MVIILTFSSTIGFKSDISTKTLSHCHDVSHDLSSSSGLTLFHVPTVALAFTALLLVALFGLNTQ